MRPSHTPGRPPWIVLGAVTVVAIFTCEFSMAEVLDKTRDIAGTAVQYKVILPGNYDSEKVYPGVLAFGGGRQTMDIVENTIRRNWRDEAERRGYIIILPAAPGGDLFFDGGERIFPEFLEKLLSEYRIADGKFHIAGISNGGISAFHIAALYPQYFLSVTAFPGFLPEATEERVQAISKLCINMHVGEFDQLGWTSPIERQADALAERVERPIHHRKGATAPAGNVRRRGRQETFRSIRRSSARVFPMNAQVLRSRTHKGGMAK